MGKRIRALLVEPMVVPRILAVDHTLETLQTIVGGYIQAVYPWKDPVGLICNEDGIALGLPLNRMLKDENGNVYDVVHGTFLVAGLSCDNFSSISHNLASKYAELFRYPELYMKTEDGRVICFKIGSNEQPVYLF